MHKPSTRKMSDAHEKFLAELLGGERQRNSGAVWSRQMDVRNDGHSEFSWAVDGKATFGNSIGVSRDMWQKAVEQANELRPLLALRWYDTWHLDVGTDLIVVEAQDFKALNEMAAEAAELRAENERLKNPVIGIDVPYNPNGNESWWRE